MPIFFALSTSKYTHKTTRISLTLNNVMVLIELHICFVFIVIGLVTDFLYLFLYTVRHGHDHKVVEFTSTNEISGDHF
jgi:amino acid transporter